MHDNLQRESHKSDVCYRTHMTAFATKQTNIVTSTTVITEM